MNYPVTPVFQYKCHMNHTKFHHYVSYLFIMFPKNIFYYFKNIIYSSYYHRSKIIFYLYIKIILIVFTNIK